MCRSELECGQRSIGWWKQHSSQKSVSNKTTEIMPRTSWLRRFVVAGLKVLAFFCRRDSGIAQPCWSRCTLAKQFGIAGLPSHVFVCLDTRSCILQGIRSRHRVAVNHAIIKQVSKSSFRIKMRTPNSLAIATARCKISGKIRKVLLNDENTRKIQIQK